MFKAKDSEAGDARPAQGESSRRELAAAEQPVETAFATTAPTKPPLRLWLAPQTAELGHECVVVAYRSFR